MQTGVLEVQELDDTDRGEQGFGSSGLNTVVSLQSEKAGGKRRNSDDDVDTIAGPVSFSDAGHESTVDDGASAVNASSREYEGTVDDGANVISDTVGCCFKTVNRSEEVGCFELVGNDLRYIPPKDYKDWGWVPKTVKAGHDVLSSLKQCQRLERLARIVFCDLERCKVPKRNYVMPELMNKSVENYSG